MNKYGNEYCLPMKTVSIHKKRLDFEQIRKSVLKKKKFLSLCRIHADCGFTSELPNPYELLQNLFL